MNTRSCLLTVGVSALIATGSVLTAVPATAAPGSADCLSAQTALSKQLGIASVDIDLANQLREGLSAYNALGAQLDPLLFEAELSLEDEWVALELAWEAEADADIRVTDAHQRAEEADPADPIAVEAAGQELIAAQAELEKARAAVAAADAAFEAASNSAFGTPEIISLEQQIEAVATSLDDAFARLGLTEGSDPAALLALADAAVAACSAPATAQVPVRQAAAPQQRGLNIQTAARDADGTDPANIGLLAGFGAAAAAGAIIVVRRRSTERV